MTDTELMDDRERDELLIRLDQRTERVDENLDRLDTEVSRMDGRQDQIAERVKRNETILQGVTAGLGAVLAAGLAKIGGVLKLMGL